MPRRRERSQRGRKGGGEGELDARCPRVGPWCGPTQVQAQPKEGEATWRGQPRIRLGQSSRDVDAREGVRDVRGAFGHQCRASCSRLVSVSSPAVTAVHLAKGLRLTEGSLAVQTPETTRKVSVSGRRRRGWLLADPRGAGCRRRPLERHGTHVTPGMRVLLESPPGLDDFPLPQRAPGNEVVAAIPEHNAPEPEH